MNKLIRPLSEGLFFAASVLVAILSLVGASILVPVFDIDAIGAEPEDIIFLSEVASMSKIWNLIPLVSLVGLVGIACANADISSIEPDDLLALSLPIMRGMMKLPGHK